MIGYRQKNIMKKMKSILLVWFLMGTSSLFGSESPVAAGFSIGMGLPWVFHFKPELIIRPIPKKPSLSFFVELNSVVLVAEASYGLSINNEGKSGYMNSVYIGSGDDIISDFGGQEGDTWRKQFMIGWELKKEYGHDFGYFLNAGLNMILNPETVFPKANIGFFFLPGF
jgi:hypothetical protein